MRAWLLCVLLLVPPAVAAGSERVGPAPDELARMNAANRAWDRYVDLSLKDDPATTALLAASSVRHYGFLRDVARFGSTEQVRRLLPSDRAVVYCLRARKDDARLAALDDAAAARLVFDNGWDGVTEGDDGRAPRLSHVTLIDEATAIGEFAPPTGSQFQFGPELVLEDGQWKVVAQSLGPDSAQVIQTAVRQSGLSETEMMQSLVAQLLGDEELPNLAVLDRPLRDDATMRTRLNESWPDYSVFYRGRFRAVEKKADEGDGFAQFVYGALLYGDGTTRLVMQDKPRGLAYLEKASQNGNVRAAWTFVLGLMADAPPPKDKVAQAERLRRVLPHVRRAAEGGVPEAMGELGTFYFNGAAGLPRDCRAAEEWQARAEDAGDPQARNDRAWTLAVCPIAEQRDPARALELAGAMIARADELSPAELDTVAAVYAANGRFAEATDFQQRAISALGKDDDAMRRGMKQRLLTYQSRRGWTQSYSIFELAE